MKICWREQCWADISQAYLQDEEIIKSKQWPTFANSTWKKELCIQELVCIITIVI